MRKSLLYALLSVTVAIAGCKSQPTRPGDQSSSGGSSSSSSGSGSAAGLPSSVPSSGGFPSSAPSSGGFPSSGAGSIPSGGFPGGTAGSSSGSDSGSQGGSSASGGAGGVGGSSGSSPSGGGFPDDVFPGGSGAGGTGENQEGGGGDGQSGGQGGEGPLSAEEQVAVLDGELDSSIAVFDGMILDERSAVRGVEDANLEEGLPGAGDEPLFEEGDITESGTTPPIPAGGVTAGSDDSLPAGETVDGDGEVVQTARSDGGVPPDLIDGSDDDIVARQIREAAMKEQDPVLREKLWEEYRKYKNKGS